MWRRLFKRDYAGNRERVINDAFRTMARRQAQNREIAIRLMTRRNDLASKRPGSDGREALERAIAAVEAELAMVRRSIREEEARFRLETAKALAAGPLVEAEIACAVLDANNRELREQ